MLGTAKIFNVVMLIVFHFMNGSLMLVNKSPYNEQKVLCKTFEAVRGIHKISQDSTGKNYTIKIDCQRITDCNEVSDFNLNICIVHCECTLSDLRMVFEMQ